MLLITSFIGLANEKSLFILQNELKKITQKPNPEMRKIQSSYIYNLAYKNGSHKCKCK